MGSFAGLAVELCWLAVFTARAACSTNSNKKNRTPVQVREDGLPDRTSRERGGVQHSVVFHSTF